MILKLTARTTETEVAKVSSTLEHFLDQYGILEAYLDAFWYRSNVITTETLTYKRQKCHNSRRLPFLPNDEQTKAHISPLVCQVMLMCKYRYMNLRITLCILLEVKFVSFFDVW